MQFFIFNEIISRTPLDLKADPDVLLKWNNVLQIFYSHHLFIIA